jgi:hypothetical protein
LNSLRKKRDAVRSFSFSGKNRDEIKKRVKEWCEEEIGKENEPKKWLNESENRRQSEMKELSWSGMNEERDESQER